MNYYLIIENEKIIGKGQSIPNNLDYIEVTKEIYDDYNYGDNKYIYSNGEIIINPDFENEQAEKREKQFKTDFFFTSLGYIRRKVSMKTGEKKDFLTDLLPVISMAVSQGQSVNVITYSQPDFTQEEVDWESLQTIKQATPQFIQECFNQINADFTGI